MPAAQLLLVTRNRPQLHRAFEDLARRVAEEDPALRAWVVEDQPARRIWRQLLALPLRPTLVVAPRRLLRLRPWRGEIRQGVDPTKAWELARLDAAGVPTPRWHLLDGPEAAPVPDLGPWVVSKPNRGGRGREVRVVRGDRIRWRQRYAQRGGVVLQEFVYTGRWPVSYRVSTLFGDVLYATRTEASHDRPPLGDRDGFGRAANGGFPLVATARGGLWSLSEDEEILEMGRRAAAAFPEVPLLGVDLVRDVETGRCCVLEVNANGQTWHLDSPSGLEVQRTSGLDFAAQFDARKVAARALARETRRLAR